MSESGDHFFLHILCLICIFSPVMCSVPELQEIYYNVQTQLPHYWDEILKFEIGSDLRGSLPGSGTDLKSTKTASSLPSVWRGHPVSLGLLFVYSLSLSTSANLDPSWSLKGMVLSQEDSEAKRKPHCPVLFSESDVSRWTLAEAKMWYCIGCHTEHNENSTVSVAELKEC